MYRILIFLLTQKTCRIYNSTTKNIVEDTGGPHYTRHHRTAAPAVQVASVAALVTNLHNQFVPLLAAPVVAVNITWNLLSSHFVVDELNAEKCKQ